MAAKFCPTCNYVGTSTTKSGGNILIEIVLWIFFIIPGLIYTLWRLTSKQQVCPKCKNPVVPVSTPVARQFIAQNHIDIKAASLTGEGAALNLGRTFILSFIAISVIYIFTSDNKLKATYTETQAQKPTVSGSSRQSAVTGIFANATVTIAGLNTDNDSGTMILAIENRTNKTLSDIQGKAVFKLTTGEQIATIPVSQNADIKPRSTSFLTVRNIELFDLDKVAAVGKESRDFTWYPIEYRYRDGSNVTR